MSSVYVVCWIFLQTFQTYFCTQTNSVDPDPKGAVWSGSTLFAKMTFKITSRWQSRRQLYCKEFDIICAILIWFLYNYLYILYKQMFWYNWLYYPECPYCLNNFLITTVISDTNDKRYFMDIYWKMEINTPHFRRRVWGYGPAWTRLVFLTSNWFINFFFIHSFVRSFLPSFLPSSILVGDFFWYFSIYSDDLITVISTGSSLHYWSGPFDNHTQLA